jgi:hypothetical protein
MQLATAGTTVIWLAHLLDALPIWLVRPLVHVRVTVHLSNQSMSGFLVMQKPSEEAMSHNQLHTPQLLR